MREGEKERNFHPTGSVREKKKNLGGRRLFGHPERGKKKKKKVPWKKKESTAGGPAPPRTKKEKPGGAFAGREGGEKKKKKFLGRKKKDKAPQSGQRGRGRGKKGARGGRGTDRRPGFSTTPHTPLGKEAREEKGGWTGAPGRRQHSVPCAVLTSVKRREKESWKLPQIGGKKGKKKRPASFCPESCAFRKKRGHTGRKRDKGNRGPGGPSKTAKTSRANPKEEGNQKKKKSKKEKGNEKRTLMVHVGALTFKPKKKKAREKKKGETASGRLGGTVGPYNGHQYGENRKKREEARAPCPYLG